ncbi:uncharacterized protein LOC111692966 [Anoplophora glabripennis]|uniref:uncharacterized protein LOC111692966 n=1 Tax=Anoplophora glabripennis TaxID=217634 RepID=UPI000C791B47|nr:uncharacterized protein LOC111692966 [Anoplophora glabripennis]
MGMDDENVNVNNLPEVHSTSVQSEEYDGENFHTTRSLEAKEKSTPVLKTTSISSESSNDDFNFPQNDTNIHDLSTILEISHENVNDKEEMEQKEDPILNYLTLRSNDIPSLETCQEFIHNEVSLQNRTPLQLRTWVINEKKRIEQKSSGTSYGWNTPAKQLCRDLFKDYYNTGYYPNKKEMQDAICRYPELRHTTVPKLRSHLQHDYEYIKMRKVE